MHTRNLLRALPRCLLAAALAAGVTTTAIYAVDGDPPGLFELDGDTAPSNSWAGDDWDDVFLNNLTTPPKANTGILPDLPIIVGGKTSDPSIFTQGTSDTDDVDEWSYTSGSVPDKNEITNAYALGYTLPADVSYDGGPVVHHEGDLVIYFGLDRYANNGDAQAGFWFFQQDVAPDGNGGFTGEHTPRTASGPGDLLVLVDYPQGANAVPVIRVLEWDPTDFDGDGNVAANLDELYNSSDPGSAPALCDGDGNKLVCAITNPENLPGAPAWEYTPKKTGPTVFDGIPSESFFEGGINVSALLGGEVPCFSSFLAETRASASETAELKDWVLGNFDLCSIAVTKACNAVLEEDGDQIKVSFDGKVTNTGGLTLFDIVVKDDMGTPDDPTDDETYLELDELAAGAEHPYDGSYFTTSLNNPLTDTVTATGSRGTAEVSAEVTAECEPPVLHPALDVTKVCTDQALNADANGIVGTFQVTVTNTGDVKLENVAVTDITKDPDEAVTLDKTVLLPGEFATGTVVHEAAFASTVADEVKASATAVLGGPPDDDSATAECSLDVPPSIAIDKVCTDAAAFGSPIEYKITVTNDGEVQLLNVEVVDDKQALPVVIGTLDPGEEFVIEDSYTPATAGAHTNTATVEGFGALDDELVSGEASATCEVPPPPDFEGCTPGFWKTHTEAWEVYSPGDLVGSVFTIPGSPPQLAILANDSLLTALDYPGGSSLAGAAQILLRAAVASLLNAAHSGVDFPLTEQQVKDAVNAALATGDRATILALASDLNDDNNLGCPLGNSL